MQYPSYPIDDRSPDHLLYLFTSKGPKGDIFKLVEFLPLPDELFPPAFRPVLNLALLDYDPVTGKASDTSRSDNGDRDMVLATVAQTIYQTTSFYPGHLVYFLGSTGSRTRLYRRVFSLLYEQIAVDFTVLGKRKDVFEVFIPGVDYEGFLLKRK